MVSQVNVILETLHCIRESDSGGNSHSEPYIWPFLGIITSNSFESTPTAAILSDSRNVIKKEMRAGDIAPIPYPLDTLIANFQDSQTNRQLLLVVGLWEQDNTPMSAVQAGYQAFLDELHAAIGSNLLALSQADDATQKTIIDNIKTRVYNKVYSAEEGKLSTWEKTKVYLGWLNLDDFMGSDFKRFPDLTPTTFTLSLKGFSGDLIIHNAGSSTPTATNPPVEYEIKGNLKIQPVVVNICQAQVDAVNAAQAALKGLQDQVHSLQLQLQHATPQEKSGIIAQITRINTVQIPPAQAALDNAKVALEKCKALLTHPERAPVTTTTLG